MSYMLLMEYMLVNSGNPTFFEAEWANMPKHIILSLLSCSQGEVE